MPKTTYRGGLPKADKRGYIRPDVGGKRFTVGNIRDVGNAEMERRHNDLRDLFDRQCEHHGIDYWSTSILPYAKRIAAGEKLVFRVSPLAKSNAGQASEEAQCFQELRALGLDVIADDPDVILRGEKEFKDLIDSKVREEVARALSNTEKYFERFPSGLVDRVRESLPTDFDRLETRTFHDAIDAYCKHRRSTGKKQENGQPSPSVKLYLRNAKRLKKETTDFPMWEISDKDKLDEQFAYWRNRPVSKKTGQQISHDHSKHTMDCLWSVLTFVDESTSWKWELPKGANRICRTPVLIDADRRKRRTRRVSKNTYTPEQLAVIANSLDRFGKLILGISVNCGMQPAEIGRLEVHDFYQNHPETGEEGDWVVFDRPKTFEYGEWRLWPEVAALASWGKARALRLGTERIIVDEDGSSWYREDWENPSTKFCKWWQAIPCKTDSTSGVVTTLNAENPEFPRFTIKYLRKILPNLLRPIYGEEIADLVNARKVDRHGRVAGRDTDRYADRLYDEAAKAVLEQRTRFQPFLDALRSDSVQPIVQGGTHRELQVASM